MIYVPRKTAEAATPRPPNSWFHSAKQARKEAVRKKGKVAVKKEVYAHHEVRTNLEALFHNKCSYCETKLSRLDWEVEHYRPKGAVRERPDHPGYYWLTYEWGNLFPACTWCNQRRKERPRLGSSSGGGIAGKGDSFPLADETSRAMKPSDNIKNEKTLLINPSEDDPAKFLAYKIDGQIYAIAHSRKGETTIRTMHLFESRLRDDREDAIDLARTLLRIRASALARGDMEAVEQADKALKSLAEGRQEYSGAVRYVLFHPEEFGI